MDDVLTGAEQQPCPACGGALRSRPYGLYCGGCDVDIIDIVGLDTPASMDPVLFRES